MSFVNLMMDSFLDFSRIDYVLFSVESLVLECHTILVVLIIAITFVMLRFIRFCRAPFTLRLARLHKWRSAVSHLNSITR